MESETPESSAASGTGRRVEIMLSDDLYERVRIRAMRQRKSLRALGAELFAAWVDDETSAPPRSPGTPSPEPA